MFIELVDALRCPRTHDESSLVLGTARMDARNVVQGVLGCPVCRARYPITNGVADLRVEAGMPAGATRGRTPAAPSAPAAAKPVTAADPERAVRLAALLDLADGHGFAVLMGEWTVQAAGVAALTGTHLLLVNPASGVAIGEGMSGMLVSSRLPLATGSARGLAVDRTVGPAFLAQAVSAVQPRGRVVAPAGLAVPDGVTELTRDADWWVGERDVPASGIVPLARGPR